jgi:hypothetical protein
MHEVCFRLGRKKKKGSRQAKKKVASHPVELSGDVAEHDSRLLRGQKDQKILDELK